jgi:ABC-type Fe3+/spermidine/putrescine transport system ATPase subunit
MTAAPREAVFHARGLSKVYRMGEVAVHALRSVDLELYEGEFVVLLGPSGSGKSTLLNILGGLDVPTSGEVPFRDHNLVKADERELTRFRREHVGFVFQFYNLIPSLTALENVELVTEIAERPMPADEALRLVGLGDGYRVESRIVIWETNWGLKAPLSALFRSGQRWNAFVVENGFAKRREVETGHRADFEVEVLSGLREDEIVISHPSNLVADGVRVSVDKK